MARKVIASGRRYPAPRRARRAADARGDGVVLLEVQNQLLEMVARGAPLEQVLPTINRFIESQIPGALCSILRLEGDRLWHCSGESLPAAYRACDGFVIGPGVGACGHAAFTGELTITDDLATHPNWAPIRSLALSFGLRSAWSMPIRATDGEILGTFGIYTRAPATPTREHLKLIEVASHLAGLAIAQEQSKRTLEERAHALAEADLRKDAFLATLAHELRNPLAAMSTALELMRSERSSASVQARARDVVGRQVGALVHMVDDLLDVSRITHGKIRLDRAPCEVRDLVQRALESTRPLIDLKQHRVVVADPGTPIRVDGDSTRLVQVMGNLLGNAAKYTEPGGTIDVAWRAAGNDLILEVRDSGEGMGPDLLPYVFDLFVQGDRSLAKAGGGLGIGLTLVRTIVELHGGHVSASSPGPGQGSVFTVRLPTCARPVPATTAAASSPVALPSGSGRVLVVDDNAEAAELLSEALRAAGYDVRTAGDGLAALRVAAQWDPQAVLLDIGLPQLDGYAVARELRRRTIRPALRLIALTGYGQPSDRDRAAEAGFDALLVKPAPLDAVFGALAGLPS